MAKCDLCGQPIKTGVDEWEAKSAFNYHFLCFKKWSEGKGSSSFDEIKGEYVEDSNYE